MCIAIYSPKGTDIPKREYLLNSFNHNPDGAGFAFNLNGKVKIQKGFMKFEDFEAAFNSANDKYGFKERGVLIHFRIGTAGTNSPGNTHPFPIVDDHKILHSTDLESNFAMIHNGIISMTNTDPMIKQFDISDTMVFVLKYMAPLASNPNWISNKNNMEIIAQLVGSYNKIAAIDGDGNIAATGNFVHDKDGNFYSNSTYSYASTYARGGGYYAGYYSGCYGGHYYDDYDDDDYYDRYYNRGAYSYQAPAANKKAAKPASAFEDDDEKYYGSSSHPTDDDGDDDDDSDFGKSYAKTQSGLKDKENPFDDEPLSGMYVRLHKLKKGEVVSFIDKKGEEDTYGTPDDCTLFISKKGRVFYLGAPMKTSSTILCEPIICLDEGVKVKKMVDGKPENDIEISFEDLDYDVWVLPRYLRNDFEYT